MTAVTMTMGAIATGQAVRQALKRDACQQGSSNVRHANAVSRRNKQNIGTAVSLNPTCELPAWRRVHVFVRQSMVILMERRNEMCA